MIKIILMALLLFPFTACVGMKGFGSKQPDIDQLVLQENIQRFYARFTESVVQGFWDDPALEVTAKDTILKQYLLYDQEALKIATAPYPEINLLDMLVFIKLNKEVIRRYWIPEVYQKNGWGIYQAFVQSEKDIDRVALKVLSVDQLETITQGVRDWLNENPYFVRVEKIRVADFTKFARTKNDKSFSFSISQLFVDTKSAVKAVDQVTLVGNRALFLAQHMPLLMRLHARIGSQEILTDSISTLQGAPALAEGISEVSPLITNMNSLVLNIKDLMNRPKKKKPTDINHALDQMDSVVTKGTLLLREANTLKTTDGSTLKELMRYAGKIMIIVAATTSAFWWGGYYICKRMLNGPLKKETL